MIINEINYFPLNIPLKENFTPKELKVYKKI